VYVRSTFSYIASSSTASYAVQPLAIAISPKPVPILAQSVMKPQLNQSRLVVISAALQLFIQSVMKSSPLRTTLDPILGLQSLSVFLSAPTAVIQRVIQLALSALSDGVISLSVLTHSLVPTGVALTLYSYKTHRSGPPITVEFAAFNDPFCVVNLLRRWYRLQKFIQLALSALSDGVISLSVLANSRVNQSGLAIQSMSGLHSAIQLAALQPVMQSRPLAIAISPKPVPILAQSVMKPQRNESRLVVISAALQLFIQSVMKSSPLGTTVDPILGLKSLSVFLSAPTAVIQRVIQLALSALSDGVISLSVLANSRVPTKSLVIPSAVQFQVYQSGLAIQSMSGLHQLYS
jgi:hypothetical protein